jgi:hypothetical protein
VALRSVLIEIQQFWKDETRTGHIKPIYKRKLKCINCTAWQGKVQSRTRTKPAKPPANEREVEEFISITFLFVLTPIDKVNATFKKNAKSDVSLNKIEKSNLISQIRLVGEISNKALVVKRA